MLMFMCNEPGDTTSKFHAVSSLLSVLKFFDASVKVPLALRKWAWPKENENVVTLESASFIVIMLLHEGLTHIH